MTELTPAEAVFFAAAALPVVDRAAYLERACAGNDDLRRLVERMLAARPEIGDFLEHPRASAPDGTTGTFAPDAPRADSADSAEPTADYPGKDEHAGAVIGGKYTLVEPIGEGGMGAVWRAKQTEPVKRFVAVKLIKPGMDSRQVLARFEAERQALALMDHPNIAKVLDGGLHEHRPFFVMELVKGVPITEYCDHHKLTPKARLELFVQACQAIQHAHQKGIIHRDLKPSNVLVALYDDRPMVKVIDFGVAKATGGTLTEATLDTGFGGVVGTPQYMSPEQATFNNLDIDTRSDVYALGVLLYELLAGSPPFSKKELEKRGLLEILRVVREEEPPRPSTKLSTADALPSLSANRSTEPNKLTGLLRNDLDWIVMKALEKDRTRRYETANGFAADVQRYIAGEAVLAHPPSAAYRLKKFVRRHKGRVIAASLVLVTLLLGIAGTTIGLFRATSAEGQARHAEVQARDALGQVTEEQVKTRAALDRAREADAASRRGLARQYVDRGGRLLDEGNTADALTWFAAAWETEADVIDAERTAVHRLRVAATAELAPKPTHVWRHGDDEAIGFQVSPDGRRVVSFSTKRGPGATSGSVRVWDLESGRSLTPPLPRSIDTMPSGSRPPSGIAMSRDGRRLVTEVWAGSSAADTAGWSAQVWDADTGRPIGKPLPAGGSGWTSLSPDGNRVLTVVPVYNDKNTQQVIGGEARVWDTVTGAAVTPPLTMPGGVGAAAFTADGTRVITARSRYAGSHDVCMIWDAATGQALTPLLRTVVHRHRPADGEVLPPESWTADRTRPIAAVLDKTAGTSFRVLDVRTGQPLTPDLPLEGRQAWYAEISPTGERLLFTTSANGTYRVADAATGKTVATLSAGAGERPMREAYFSPDGRWVYGTSAVLGREDVDANGTDGDWVRVWDARTGTPQTAAVPLDNRLAELRFDTNCGRVILRDKSAINTSAGGVRVMSFPAMSAKSPVIRHQNRVTTAEFSPGGRQILTRGGTHARVWDSDTGVPRTPVLPHSREVIDARFTPDGRFAITACAGGRVYVWPTRAGAPNGRPLIHPGETVYQLAVDPSGTRLLTASFTEPLLGSGLSGDARLSVNTTSHLETRLWDLSTGRFVTLSRRLDMPSEGQSPKFSPDGRWVIAMDLKAGLQCWDARTLALVTTLRPSPDLAGFEFADASTVVYVNSKPGERGELRFGAVRVPGGEPVAPVPKARVRPPESAVQVVGGNTVRLDRSALGSALTIEPDRWVDDGWVDGALVWTAGHRMPLKRHFMIGTRRLSTMEFVTAYVPYETSRFEVRSWDSRTGEPVLPPLTTRGVHDFETPKPGAVPRNYYTGLRPGTFATADRFGVVYAAPDGLRVWGIPRDTRSAADWSRVATAISGRRFGDGGPAVLTDEEWAAERAAFPETIVRVPNALEFESIQAEEAEWVNNLADARFHLDRLIALEPNNWRHYRRLGKVQGSNWEETIRINTRAIELGATAWQVWHNRGWAYANLGRWAEAEADFAKAVEILDEKNWRPWKMLLCTRLARGDLPGYRKALADATDADNVYAAVNASEMAVLVPDPFADPARLQPLYDRAKRAGGKLFGAICVRLGRYEEALQHLTSKPTESDEYLPLLAIAYHKLGQADKARATLDRAVAWHARHVERREPDPATRGPLPVEKRVAFAALLREAQTTIGHPSQPELAPAPRPVAPMPREKK